MADPWPPSLPQAPEPTGYVNIERGNVISSPMGYGPAKLRQRSTQALRDVTMHFFLESTGSQDVNDPMWTLDNFYTNTLERVLEFDWIDHRTGNPATYRFKAPPSISPYGTALYWDVTLELEIIG